MFNEINWLLAKLPFAALLLGEVLAMTPTTARADVVNGQCYDTFEDPEPCSTSDGCRETVYIAYCIIGNSGSSCGHGGGLCCGEIPYSTSSAEGQCETDDAKLAQNSRKVESASPATAAASEMSRSDASDDDLPRPVVFVPNLCGHSYVAIEPDYSNKNRRGGV
jgi:hypothetical protein